MLFFSLFLGFVTLSLFLVYGLLRRKLEWKLANKGFLFVSRRSLIAYKKENPACFRMDEETLTYTYFKSLGISLGATIEAGLQQPVLYLTEASLARRIMTKDSHHFVDRRSLYEPEINPLFCKMLSFLRGEEWSRLRKILTPAFSPAKMKNIFPIFTQTCCKLVTQLRMASRLNGRVDIHATIGRFTMDIISSTAFGIEAASQEDHEAITYKMGTKLQRLTLKIVFCRIAAKYFPVVAKFMQLSTFDPGALNFFASVTKEILRNRKCSIDARKDLLQILLSFHEKRQLSEDDVISQSVLFYFLGFDTLNTLLEVCCVILANEPKVQSKLRNEVKSYFKSNDLNYETVAQMPYMDKFIAETLRIYPPTSRTERTCTKDYKIPGNLLTIPAGTQVVLPIYAFHTDPKYWGSSAHDFYPDRIYTGDYPYFPFGSGPRSCLGKRFALDLGKTALAYILFNFEITADIKNIPLSTLILQRAGNFKLKKGTYLKFNSVPLNNV